jgi:hypothetical protein
MIKSKGMKFVGPVAGMGETRNVCRILVGKPEGMRPLGKLRCRWDDNIRVGGYELDSSG